MKVNIDHIADLTGSTRRTVIKRCQDLPRTKEGRSVLFESRDALPLMYGIGVTSTTIMEKKANLDKERTRLAAAQADKTELEVDVIKGSLIPAENVQEVVDNMIAAFRAKMLSLPTKAAPNVVAMADVAEAETLLKDYVYEALSELSEYDSEQYSTSNDKQSGKTGRASANTDGKPVGGRQKKAIKGSKRGTGPVEH